MNMFSKNFVAVFLVNFCVMVTYYLLFVISSPYAVEYFQASPSTAGFAAGVMVLGCLTGRFVTGRLIELAGFKKVLLVGVAIYIAGIALYLCAHTLLLLIAIRFFSGAAVGVVSSVNDTIIACIVPPPQLGLGISCFSLNAIFALALGPFLGILLVRELGYAGVFLLCLAIGVAGFGIACLLSVRAPAAPAPEQQAGRKAKNPNASFTLHDYLDVRVFPVALVVLVAALCYANAQAFISFHAMETGLTDAASVFFLMYAIVVLCTRPVTGRVFDKHGEHVVIYPALLLMAGGLLLLSRADASWELLLSGALLGAGFGNFQSITQAAAIRLVPRNRFGQATSTFYVFFNFGYGFGPYLLGLLVPLFGYRGLYLAAAVITLLAVPLYHCLHGTKANARQDNAPAMASR